MFPGGCLGSALEAIAESLANKDNVKAVAYASHYLVDLCNPFHTSVYSLVQTGPHVDTELRINQMLDKWVSEYKPNPPLVDDVGLAAVDIITTSSAMARELMNKFIKHDFKGEPYPDDIFKKILFNAVDYQIGFLDYARQVVLLG